MIRSILSVSTHGVNELFHDPQVAPVGATGLRTMECDVSGRPPADLRQRPQRVQDPPVSREFAFLIESNELISPIAYVACGIGQNRR
jgi:hypothetical protein